MTASNSNPAGNPTIGPLTKSGSSVQNPSQAGPARFDNVAKKPESAPKSSVTRG
jgi:hypothetical protein